MIISQITP